MKTGSLDFKTLIPKLKKGWQKFSGHLAFAVTMAVLVAYLFVVMHIRSLATAEPTDEAVAQAQSSTKSTKIDPKAISQIQSLEQSSPAVHTLFNQARNNPFHE